MASSAPPGFDDIHRILGAAMRAVDAASWPARPHLGGPLPVLSSRTQVEIGLAIGARARAQAARGERAEVDRLLAVAREASANPRREGFTRADQRHRDELAASSKAAARDPVAIRVAKLVVRATLNYLYSASSARNAAGTCVEHAAVALAKHLGAAERGAARDFLTTLDATLLRHELAAQLAERGLDPTGPIARVVSRPRGPKGRGLGLALAELAGGRYGLYVKLRQRWEWHEGDRASAFATVPDAYMEHVIADLDG